MGRSGAYSTDDRLLCLLCDFWWVILLIFLAGVASGGYLYYRHRQASNEPVLGTGDVQVTLRWDTTDDLDLWVTDPSGETIFYSHPASASGGKLDVDANARCNNPIDNPVENVFWPAGKAPGGHYKVEVAFYARCENQHSTVPFTVRVLVDGKVRTFHGSVSSAGDRVSIFEFTR